MGQIAEAFWVPYCFKTYIWHECFHRGSFLQHRGFNCIIPALRCVFIRDLCFLGTDMSCVWPPLSLSCDDLSPYDGADTPTAGSTEMVEMRTFSLRISNCGAVPIIP